MLSKVSNQLKKLSVTGKSTCKILGGFFQRGRGSNDEPEQVTLG